MDIVRNYIIKKSNSLKIISVLNSLVDKNSPKLIKLLVTNWNNQANAITYRELRDMIVSEAIDPQIILDWQQDYAQFVNDNLLPLWEKAIEEASNEYSSKYSGFIFDSNAIGVTLWNKNNAARFITDCTSEQTAALSALIRNATEISDMTTDSLARVIRPLIGLTKHQAQTSFKFYRTLIENGIPKNKAMDRFLRYVGQQQRYRAQMIARTEIASSFNGGRQLSVQQAQSQGFIGKCKRIWITADTERTCPYCESMDGTEVDMDEKFTLSFGVKAKHYVSVECPPAHPHCMCVLNYIEVEPPMPLSEYEDSKPKYEEATIVSDEIYTKQYTQKIESLGESKKVTKSIRQSAIKMLEHRSGTEYEDMAFIDSKTGETIIQSNYQVKHQVEPTKQMKKMLSESPQNTIIAIHNHPRSSVPSFADLNTCFNRHYKYGIVVCHNGIIFKYKVTEPLNNSTPINIGLDSLHSAIYNRHEKNIKNDLEYLKNYNIELEIL